MWATARQVFLAAILDKDDIALEAYLDILEESGASKTTREEKRELLLRWRNDTNIVSIAFRQRLRDSLQEGSACGR